MISGKTNRLVTLSPRNSTTDDAAMFFTHENSLLGQSTEGARLPSLSFQAYLLSGMQDNPTSMSRYLCAADSLANVMAACKVQMSDEGQAFQAWLAQNSPKAQQDTSVTHAGDAG